MLNHGLQFVAAVVRTVGAWWKVPLCCCVLATLAQADTLALGYLEFDLDTTNNVFVTTIGNQTGLSGCSPSFPACDALRFLNGSLTVDYVDGLGVAGSLTIPLADPVDPGTDLPPELQLDGGLTLLDATFTGALDTPQFLLFDSTVFNSDGTVSGTGDLTAQNFFFVSAETEPIVTAPEPSSIWYFALGLPLLVLREYRRRPAGAKRK